MKVVVEMNILMTRKIMKKGTKRIVRRVIIASSASPTLSIPV